MAEIDTADRAADRGLRRTLANGDVSWRFTFGAANESDIDGILEIVNGYAAQNLMLPRTAEQIRRALPGFLVADDGRQGGRLRLDVSS